MGRLLVAGDATVTMLNLRWAKAHCVLIAIVCQSIDDRPAGVAKSKQFGYFVVGFSSSVVAGASDVLINPALFTRLRQEQMCMAAGDYQRQHWKLDGTIAFLA